MSIRRITTIQAFLGKPGQPARIEVFHHLPEAEIIEFSEVIMSNVRAGLPLRYGIDQVSGQPPLPEGS